jgi:hypothetical protein
VAALLGAACATPGPRFVSAARLEFDASKYPDDAAVVLHRADKTELVTANDWYTRYERHVVSAVLGEGGFDLAEVRVPLRSTWKLLRFDARVVQPDGTEQRFDAAQLLSDSSGKGEHDLNAKFFRFPDVRVGSVLEYSWLVKVPELWNADEQDTLGNFPVRHYEFELTSARQLVLGTIVFNGGSPITVRTLADGRHQLQFELANLPRRKTADFSPHWTFTEPRWAWRVLAYQDRGLNTDWLRNWKDVVERKGRAFFVDDALEKGLAVPLDVTGCADVKCKVERAMKLMVERTTTLGVPWSRQEKLASALASGKTSVVERALLLKFLLAREGLDVWLGYGTGKLSQQAAQDFPRLAQFDHLFVFLPAQQGLAREVAVDPSCDYCGFGQLPDWFQGTPLYVFKSRPNLGDVLTADRWVHLGEVESPASRFVVKHQAELHPDGTLSAEISVRVFGNTAQAHRERSVQWPAKKLAKSEQETLSRVSPLAKVDSAKWAECSPSSCGWDTRVEFPLEASADGQRWLVPTTVLWPLWEGVFESPKRELDVHFADQEALDEVWELTVPAGLELVDVPKPLTFAVQGFSGEVSFEKTAQGARVRRKATRDVGVVPKADYPALREAVEGFRRGRREVLVFAPRK